MKPFLTHHLRYWLVLFCIVLSCVGFSNLSFGQQITITLNSQTYSCLNGTLNFYFHISNDNGSGGLYQSFLWGISNGPNSTGTTYSGSSQFDGQYQGPYDPTSPLTIWAVGYGNNSAARKEYTFVPSISNSLSKPYIAVAGNPLCPGGTATLTASGYGGSFEWSTGATGSSLSVNETGPYRARIVNTCGAGPWSDPVTISSGSIPAAPSISTTATALCSGASTELYVSYHTGGSIRWNTGATGNSINVSTPGTYYATESNACGTGPQSLPIVITSGVPPAAPVIASSNGTNLCNGALTTISVTSPYTGSIRWSGGQTGDYITVSGAGTYRAYETSACGNSEWSNPIVITTMGNPTGPIITPNVGRLLCNGESVLLTVANPSGPVRWSTGETGNSITINTAGTYYATQTNACATSGAGNLVTFTTANTPGKIAITASATTLCAGQSVTLTAQPTAGGSITWSNGATGNQISVSASGTYTARESNACGNGAESEPVVISSGATPAAPVIYTSSPSILCDGATGLLSIQGTPEGTVTWSTGETGTSISVNAAGAYSARISNGCGTSSASNLVTFTTLNKPQAPLINPAGSVTICTGGSATLAAVGAGSFMWYRDDNYISSAGNVVVSSAGNYTVKNQNACGASPSSNTVSVEVSSRPDAPSVTPPGNYLLCNGQSATFTATGTNITWSNGQTGSTLTTASTGTYYAFDRNGCGNSANSNAVVITTGSCPTPSPGTSFFVCPGSLKTLDAGTGYESYLWNTGETTQKITVGPGNYAVTVTKEGCSATSVIVTVAEYQVTVPSISASGPLTFCNGGSVTLTASNGTGYLWSTGVSTASVTIRDAGAYSVNVTDANGCKATSLTVSVTINPVPSATITGSTTVCRNATSPQVTFTGSNGMAPYTFFYRVNGGALQTISTVNGSNSVGISVPVSTAGQLIYELTEVQESSATTCKATVSATATVTVSELPGASITGSTIVCKNSASPVLTFTGSNGTAPYTFTYSVNGGTVQTVRTAMGSTATVAVPTDATGEYEYRLLSVQESSGITCMNSVTTSALVKVLELPVATLTGDAVVCQYSGAPVVTFTGSNGIPPYKFVYRLNNGSEETISTSAGNSVTIGVPTTAPGQFVYALLRVSESGNGICAAVTSGTVTVTVNAQPATPIIAAPNTHLCNGETGTLTILNWQEGFTYTWFKDGAEFTSTTLQSINILSAGTYTVRVKSNAGCLSSAVSNPVIITTGSIPQPVITGKLRVCEGGSTILSVISPIGAAAYDRYRWEEIHREPPLVEVMGTDRSFSAFAGQYRLFVERQGCMDSSLITVSANDTEFPAGEFKATPSWIPYGGKTRLSASLTNTDRYEWDFGDGRRALTRTGSVDQTFYTVRDSILVKVQAISERNCKTDFYTVIRLGKPEPSTIPDRSFAGNLKDWNFFPVPFRDALQLSVILRKSESIKLDFFTADGSWVQTYELSGRKGENLFSLERLNLLAPGVLYYVTGIYNGEKHYDKIFKY